MDFLIVVAFGFLLIYLFIMLPQRRRQSTHQKMLDALAIGDEVLTAGGIYGYVTELAQDEIAIEVADGVELRVAKRAVAQVMPPEDDEDEEDADPEAAEEAEDAPAEAPEARQDAETTGEPRG